MSVLPAPLLDAMSRLVNRLPRTVLDSVASSIARSDRTGAEGTAVLREVPALTPENREAFDDVLRLWLNVYPKPSGEVFAAALEAMAWESDAARRRLSVDLVWTGPPVSGQVMRSTDQRIIELIDSATRSIWIVAFAAYRIPSIVAAFERAIGRGVQLSFVLEDSGESQGKVSFDPIHAFGASLAGRANVYLWPMEQRQRDERGRHGALHAKCLLVDGEALFVSSANFTEFAMTVNLELGALIKSREIGGDVERLFERLIATGVLTQA